MSRMHRHLLGPRAALVGLLAVLLTAGTATASTYTITLDGTPLTMKTTTAGEKATASFTGTAGHRLSVRVSSATIQSYTISVKNPDGTTLKSAGPWNVTGGFLGPLTMATTGTYKIVIAPGSTYKGSAVVQAYDVPNDATGTILTDGTTATQTYTTPGQNGTLTFSATSGQRISLLAGAGATTARNVTVSIKAPSGAIVLAATPVGTGGLFFGPLTLSETGTYTIIANPPKTTTGSTDYQLWVVPADQTGTLTIGGGNQVLTFAAAGQNASLTFSGTASQKLTLSVAASLTGVNGATVKVRKPDNTVLSTLAVTNSGTLMEPTTLPATGTYTVTVDPTAQAVGTITLNLFTSPADLSGSLTSGTPTTLNLATIGQNAGYTISGTAGQYLSLRFANDSISSTSVSVKTPSATTLIAATTFNASGKFFDGVVLPATGTYTISINPQSVSTGSVDVTAYVYTNPTPYTATLGTPLTVTTIPGQNAAVTFTAPAAPNKVSILLNGITDGSGPTLGITGTLTTGATTVTSFTFGNSDKFVEPITVTAGATYKLLLDPAGSNTGSITTTIYSVPADAAFTSTLGAPTAISVAIPGQNMKTTFTGTAGHQLSLWFDTVTIGNPISNPTIVTLTSPTSTTVTTFNLYQHNTMIEPVTLPSTGTYTLSFNPNGANTGSFNVTPYDVPADATNTATIGGGKVTATTTVPGQNAQFTFSSTSATPVTITLDVSSPSPAFISVLKGGVVVKAASSFASNPGDSISFTPATGTNTYVIKVDPTVNNVGSYVLSVS
jgi:hypothetical protein